MRYSIPYAEKLLNVPAARLLVTKDSVTTVDLQVPACHVALHRWQPNTPDPRGWPFLFSPGRQPTVGSGGAAFLRLLKGAGGTLSPGAGAGGPLSPGSAGANNSPNPYPKLVSLPARDIQRVSEICAISPGGRFLFTGGHADCSVKLIAVESGRVIESAALHCEPVSCLALSEDGKLLVSGALDATLLVWKTHLWHAAPSTSSGSQGAQGGSSSPQDTSLVAATAGVTAGGAGGEGGRGHESGGALGASGGGGGGGTPGPAAGGDANRRSSHGGRRIEGPLRVLRGHGDAVACVAVSADLDCVVSASASTGVVLHSLLKGRFQRRLPSIETADLLAISSEGYIAAWSDEQRTIRVFTINGIEVAGVQIPPEDGEVSSLLVSADGLHLAVGTSVGGVPRGRRRSSSVYEPDSSQGGSSSSTSSGSSPHASRRRARTNSVADSEGSGSSKLCFSQSLGAESRSSMPAWSDWRAEEVRNADDVGGPSICLLEIFTLKVVFRYRLAPGHDVTALSLAEDNTGMLCSTSSGHLVVYADPQLSVKLVDQMLRLGWEGSGFLS
eukprot:TRINITY_DN695_c0_g1_i4.p1 TRINITY_DN695_c0_g1~~TRINITY_DN695_c0_g1_i4.p1  ORF type:complete len:556 (+),score=109.02 TRINITY_DN695_c0_g1_i4:106-1773(+)